MFFKVNLSDVLYIPFSITGLSNMTNNYWSSSQWLLTAITKLCSFTDLPLGPDSPLLDGAADIDFGFDSGIEAEMDEPQGNA